MIVRYLLKNISARKHPNTSSVKRGQIEGLKPDIVFISDNEEWVLDVAFCKQPELSEGAFQEKIHKYQEHFDGVIPVIISYRGFIYEKSRDLLSNILPEIQ